MSVSSYSVGNRVYNGGSSAPTRGTVDPMGYIDREANKVASQSRSGLAEAALRKLSGNENQQQSGGAGFSLRAAGSAPAGANTPRGGVGNYLTAANVNKPSVNLQGRITAPVPQTSSISSSVGFDSDAAGAQELLAAENQRVNSDFQETESQFLRDIMLAERDVQNAKPQDQRELLENYGGRGMVQSSGYAHDFGQLEGEYSKMLQDLYQGRDTGIADLARQRGSWNNEFGARLRSIQAAAVRREAEMARVKAEQEARAREVEEENRRRTAEEAARQQSTFNPNPTESAPNFNNDPGANLPYGQPTVNPATIPNPATGNPVPIFSSPQGGINGPWNPAPAAQQNPQAVQQAAARAAAQSAGTTAAHGRAMSSFTPVQQEHLKNGGTIKGGDGRRFKYTNGVAEYIGM